MSQIFLRRAALALLLALPLTAALPAAASEFQSVEAETVGMSSERLQRLDQTLQSYIDNEQIAGQVTLVLREGSIVYQSAKGMQDIAEGVPMQMDSMFRIASQTKAIVSVAIMMLQERGALDINDNLSRYLPEWADMQVAVADGNGGYTLEPSRRPITLRHLLMHNAGISYGSGPAAQLWAEVGLQGWYFAGSDEPMREAIRRMAELPLDDHPGEGWLYGYATDILGVVVEEVSGSDLGSFLSQEILAPLGMNDTHFFLPADKQGRLSTVYQAAPQGGIMARPELDGMQSQGRYVDGPRVAESAGAGLLSTARDYARFLQMLLNGGELNGQRLLAPASVELMTVNHMAEIPYRPGQGFGLGFWVVEDLGARGMLGSLGEYGWGGAYHSTYWVDPAEQLVVVYLTQIIPATGLDDYSRLRNGIYQAIIR